MYLCIHRYISMYLYSYLCINLFIYLRVIYYRELPHAIVTMEAKSAHILPSARWRPRTATGKVPAESKGLRSREPMRELTEKESSERVQRQEKTSVPDEVVR